jgi:hypothetical protein
MSPTEALRLEIEIARLAAQYVDATEQSTKLRLMASINQLSRRRDPEARLDSGVTTGGAMAECD